MRFSFETFQEIFKNQGKEKAEAYRLRMSWVKVEEITKEEEITPTDPELKTADIEISREDMREKLKEAWVKLIWNPWNAKLLEKMKENGLI